MAAVELGMTFPTPSTALLQAWAAVPPEARALLELFLDAPAVIVEDLGASTAGRAGLRAHPAHRIGSFDVAAAHAVDVAITRGLPVLTAEPGSAADARDPVIRATATRFSVAYARCSLSV